MNEKDVGLIKELVDDWKDGKLTDSVAMLILTDIVYPAEFTEEELEKAKEWAREEIMAHSDEWDIGNGNEYQIGEDSAQND